MTAHYVDDRVTLWHGDCRQVLATLADASVDSCVTDPPYELGFMGKRWDASGIAHDVSMWGEVWRVLKPGGHLLAFGGTRTYHRMAAAIEDAGFEIRDLIHWLYGSGFPKSLDVSKAIDKAAGAEREVVGERRVSPGVAFGLDGPSTLPVTVAATEDVATWSGWGTALKPAHEPIVVARKPLIGTVADNVQAHGTGALNIDACRVPSDDGFEKQWDRPVRTNIGAGTYISDGTQHTVDISANRPDGGRWPSNLVLTHSADCTTSACVADCPCTVLDAQSGIGKDGTAVQRNRDAAAHVSWFGTRRPQTGDDQTYGGAGGASRFFPQSRWTSDELSVRYVAKPSRTERDKGLDDRNTHPTVKPLELMRWLVRLVTPADGIVLDPFAGSGTTLEAAVIEQCHAIGIELTADYLPIIVGRISKPIQPTIGGL